ncbi:MAG: type II toxin-antitoxin system Phd/YefM family antitoxin [Chloroflexota bacterium]
MHKLHQTFGSGELRSNAAKAFKMAQKGPVVILNRTKPQVVMVSPEQWDATAERLAFLERMLIGDKASARIQAGEFCTQEQVDEMFAE